MDVLLVHPCLEENLKYPHRARREHLGIGYLMAMLRAEGFEVAVLDCDLMDISVGDSVQAIIQRHALMVGFAVSSQLVIKETIQTIEALRSAGCSSHVFLGGHLPTFEHKGILTRYPFIDSIVRGEGEYSLAELVNQVLGQRNLAGVKGISYRQGRQVIMNEPRGLIHDLDQLPFPARDTLPYIIEKNEPASVIASRGCYGNCIFCTTHAFYGGARWRARDPVFVIDELQMLNRVYGAGYFRFYDDTFIGPGLNGHRRTIQLCQEIKGRSLDIDFDIYIRSNDIREETFSHLKQAGLKAVTCGIESGSQESLDRFRKHTTVETNREAIRILKKLDIQLRSAFIMFEPYASLENIKENFRFLLEIGEDSPDNYIFFNDEEVLAYVGTELREKLRVEGRLIKTNWADIGSYKFLDDRVGLLYQIVLLIRLKQSRLQRYWVEFDLRSRQIQRLRSTQKPDKKMGGLLKSINRFKTEAAYIPPSVFGEAINFVETHHCATHEQIEEFCGEQLAKIEDFLEKGKQVSLELDTYGI